MPVEIKKKENESVASALRRFTKKVQQSGVVSRAKKTRFRSRPVSEFKKKKAALMRIKRRKEFERLQKLGKISSVRGKRR